jgi:signal transduction histidine kinase
LTSGAWEAADWTAEFGPRRLLGPIAQVDGSAAAIVIPMFAFIQLSEPEFQIAKHEPDRLIVRLDLQYIRTEFVPTLIRSHFGDRLSDYRLQVTDNDSSRNIYSTEPGASPIEEPDAGEDLFALELEEYRSLTPATAPFHAGRHVASVHDVRVLHGWVATADTIDAFSHTVQGQWTIAVTHRAGSLDAAVTQIRTRNMAVSFGILALLGASVAIILISTERARRLAQQQMEFVSTVSHELRTPLAVICSAGENLADGVVRDSDQLKSYGKLVKNEGRRLSEMVEQILSFAGMQSGLKKYRLVPVEAASIVERALAALDMPIREGGFAVERRILPEPLIVHADTPAMDRALQNLISNAIKYSGSSKWIAVSLNKDTRWVRIAVEDRGIGISSADRPHLFEPFSRGRAAIDAQIQGSGLGLSLVKQIVEAHGGEIEVSVNAEGGSTFCIKLPHFYEEKNSTG